MSAPPPPATIPAQQPPAASAPPAASTSTAAASTPAQATATTATPAATLAPTPASAAAVPPRVSPFASRQASPNATTTASPSAQAQGAASAFRPLNVRDALSYLDRVKQQFSAEYEVYDQFLTIMKQFKTQAIDTPGVIDRVSTLFRGHPSLIQGFNTFLPPGYRIECFVSTANEQGASNTITVTTPMGITTRTQDVTGVEAREFVKAHPGASASTSKAPAGGRPGAATGATTPASGSSASTPAAGGTPLASTPNAASTSRAGATPSSAAPTATTARSVISPPAPIPPYGGGSAAKSTGATVPFWQSPFTAKPGQATGGFVNRTGAPAAPPTSTSTAAPPIASSATARPTPSRPNAEEDAAKAKSAVEASDAADAIVSSAPAVARREAATASATAAGEPAPAPAAAGGQPQVMEFNHAINYVNKIKNRFVKDPETYKTFLEILQTYQKETRPIQEVYTQVTALFHSAPDLLDEFKAFLPDTTDPNVVAAQQAQAAGAQKKKEAGGGKANGSSAKKPQAGEEKKKRAAPGMGERAKAKRAKTHHVDSPPVVPSTSKERAPDRPADRERERERDRSVAASIASDAPMAPTAAGPSPYHHIQPYGAPPPGFPGAPRMQSAYDAYLANHRSPQLVQAEEFGFFDRVKKYLDDRTTYTEFLKLLNLFTQEIIDVATLVEKSLLFFGHNEELVAQFKELVGWDPVKDGRVAGEDWIVDNESVFERPGVRLDLMTSFGPSYRKLPDSEIDLACSGREPLDWSVLNDEWVAFATWASEGSSAHRKNPYEEALYNSEQERHWYSFHIESNLRTIAYLEPIAARIALMTPEERVAFKMHEGFGGTAPSVYERIIRKVYGKDHGWEILTALFDNPSVAVPIVLSRLKQKDEEWKRAEREWNKVWREVDNKNFYRALDHQGIPFKAIDKKATTTSKALTTEIESLRRDKQQKRFDLPAASPPLRPLHQFELGMPDRDVLFDVLKLTFSFLDRDQSGFSAPERARVEAFLRLFVPLLFGVPHSEMEANLAHTDESQEGDDEDAESEADTNAGSDVEGSTPNGDSTESASTSASPASGSKKNGSGGVNKKGGAADLRKRLLKHAATAAGKGAPPKSNSRANSPEEGIVTSNGGILGEQTWIRLSESGEEEPAMDKPLPSRRFNFFANSTYYCLVRLIHTVYHRLATFKELTAQLAAEHTHRRLNPLAVELGLAIPAPVVDEGDNPAERYYEHALDLAEKLFDGDIDQQTYEEQLRYMGGVKAYPLYTVDKLISTVIKHIHTVNSDSRCQDLVTLLEKDRARDFITTRQQIAYRMEAEAAIGAEDPLYRIEWIPEIMALTIQLLGKEDLTLDDAYGSEEKMHASWVASYALTSSTEGVGAQVKAPLLKRNRMLSEAEDPQEFDIVPGLEAKVAADGYQLHFVANTEDYLHRRRPAPEPQSPGAVPVAERRKERFAKWLEEAARSGTSSRAGGGDDDVAMEGV